MVAIGFCTALLGVGAYYLLTREPAPPIQYEDSAISEDNAIKSPSEVPLLERRTKSTNDPVTHTSYDVEYPMVKLVNRADLAKSANAVIETFVTDRIDEFVHTAQEDSDTAIIDGPESSLMIRYTPTLLSPTIISIRFEVSEYWSGAAHPNSHTLMLNYDLETHTILGTEGLFASSTVALASIAELSKSSLYEQFADITENEFREQVFPGITPTLENFRSIALTPEGIMVIFDPYQVAPYARGTQSVRIPLAEVRELLTPRVVEAMKLAGTNIVEASPLEEGLMTPDGT